LKAPAAAATKGSRAVDPDTVITSSAVVDEETTILKIIIIDMMLVVIVPPCLYGNLKCKKLDGEPGKQRKILAKEACWQVPSFPASKTT
jgi:hypothetical protein